MKSLINLLLCFAIFAFITLLPILIIFLSNRVAPFDIDEKTYPILQGGFCIAGVVVASTIYLTKQDED